MKFISEEFSGIDLIISEENDLQTDQLSILVMKENFLDCSLQVEELNGISLEKMEYVEGTFQIQLSQVIKKLLELGFELSNYQVFYKAKNQCFFYVGVFPCLSDVQIPFIFPNKIFIKIRQYLQCNNENYILPQSQVEQNQVAQSIQKEECGSEGLQEDNIQTSQEILNKQQKKHSKEQQISQNMLNGKKKSLKQMKIGLMISLINNWDKASYYQALINVISQYGVNEKIISKWSYIIKRAIKFGFNLNNHIQNKISVISIYCRCHLKAQKLFQENNLESFGFQKLVRKSIMQCKVINCCVPVSPQIIASQIQKF